jgi:hypothetical protein
MLIPLLFTAFLAQTAQPSCADQAHQALDFWVGRWEVQNAAGQVTAASVIERIADGCGVLERYTGAPGPRGNRYVGSGLHVFDAETGGWRQLWSDNRPAVTVMNGTVAGSSVVYRWEVVDAQGRHIPKRYTLSPTDGGVRQFGERSDDGGTSWTAEFDLRYRRVQG